MFAGETLQEIKESNYLFTSDNGETRSRIEQWTRNSVWPISAANKVISDLHVDAEAQRWTLSVSRPRQRVQWGLPVPHDSDQTIYVWIDALTNYLTVLGLKEPSAFETHELSSSMSNSVHIIGKDIAKFHCIYWPRILMALFGNDKALPKRVFVHGHWLLDN